MSIQIRRGQKSDLPASAPDGQPLFVEDTQELYMGAVAGSPPASTVVPIKINAANIIGGGQTAITLTCGQNINAYQVVAVRSDGLAYIADASAVADANRIVGVATTSATTGNTISVQQVGVVNNNGFLFTAGESVFLGLVGALIQTVPSDTPGNFSVMMGVALSASQLELQIGTPVILA